MDALTMMLEEMSKRHGLPISKSHGRSLVELRVEDYNKQVGNLKGYDCPICLNRGRVAVIREEDGVDIFRDCECWEIRRMLKRAEASGLGDVIADKTFDAFMSFDESHQDVIDRAKAYAADPQGWFFICGQSGAGKTHICTAIVGELLRKGIPTKYMLWREDVNELKANVNNEQYPELIRPYKETKCLYIDDLFKGSVTRADLDRAFEIINHRSRKRDQLTIISTERSIAEILEMDEAVGGRIYEKTNLENMIDVGSWENYRLRK